MTAPTTPEIAERLAVYYPLLVPVTSEITGPSGTRGYLPEGFPQQLTEVAIGQPTVRIQSFSIDPNGDPGDNQGQLLEQLEFFVADVEGLLGSLQQKQQLVAIYATLPNGEGSQQLYGDLAQHFGKFHASHQELLNFYQALVSAFDEASALDKASSLAGNYDEAHRRSDLSAQLGKGQLPAAAQAHLNFARTLRQDTMDPRELKPYYLNGPPYDPEIGRLEAALPKLEELATYYAALSRGEEPVHAPLGADLRDLRLAFSGDNSAALAEYERQSEYLARTAGSFRRIHDVVESGDIGAALDDVQREQLDMLILCQEQDLWPHDMEWGQLLRSSSEREEINPSTVRINPAIVQLMLAGSAGLIEATYRYGDPRGGTPDSHISDLLEPLTHAAAVAMRTAGRPDYEQVYRRSLAPYIGRSLKAAAGSAFDAARSIRSIALKEPSAALSPPPARRPGIRGWRSPTVGPSGTRAIDRAPTGGSQSGTPPPARR